MEGAVVVLGSATPSLESFYNTQQGKYSLLELPIRADFVGKNIPTARADDVQVRLEETDGEEYVRVAAVEEAEVSR